MHSALETFIGFPDLQSSKAGAGNIRPLANSPGMRLMNSIFRVLAAH
jgi:hypothetical protein